MKKSLLLILLGVASAAALFSVFRPEPPGWTTSSKDALAEFRLGREAVMRLHHVDAREHFARALELDRDFAAARLMAYRVASYQEKDDLLEGIKQVPLDGLLAHERFLIRYEIAAGDGNLELAENLLEEFVADNPNDPWGLEKKAATAWRKFDLGAAEKHYRALLEAEPNWVTAENNLGYIAMSRGDFDAAEEHFRTYQYIAPDQANPHDSRGELLTLTGDYEEAWEEFEAALAIRPDFCATYRHQFTLAAFAHYDERIPRVVEQMRVHCDQGAAETLACHAQLIADYKSGNHRAWLEERDDDCLDKVKSNLFLHRMRVLAGEEELALKCEEDVARQQAELEAQGVDKPNPAAGFRLHLEGTRLLADGQVDAAAEKLLEADSHLVYMGHDVGLAKLINLVDLSIALELQGDDAGSKARLDQLLSVNPQMAGFHEHRKQELAFLFDRA